MIGESISAVSDSLFHEVVGLGMIGVGCYTAQGLLEKFDKPHLAQTLVLVVDIGAMTYVVYRVHDFFMHLRTLFLL